MALTTEQLSYIEQRLANDKKSALVAYLLWFFLSFLGAHRFYMGKKYGMIFVILFILTIVTIGIGIGLITFIILGLWILIDAFRIPGWITKDLEEKRERLKSELSLSIQANQQI